MATYQTGTVDVQSGSPNVTGTGTSWVSALSAGWVFVGPNGEPIGIAEVVSDTQLTLTRGYTGAHASGETYEAFPTQSLAQDLALSFQAILTDFQGAVDGPLAGRFPDWGVRFAGDPDTGMRRIGSNKAALMAGGVDVLTFEDGKAGGSMVQQTSGDFAPDLLLTTGAGGLLGDALAVPGDDIDNITVTGFYKLNGNAISGNAALGAIPGITSGSTLQHVAWSEDYAVQLVFQSPDNRLWMRLKRNGAWMGFEGVSAVSGDNASGAYIKFGGGQMIQWGVVAEASTSEVPDGAIYRGGAITFDYPVDFRAGTVPALSTSVNATTTAWSQERSLLNDAGSARIMSASPVTESLDLGWMAIGFW